MRAKHNKKNYKNKSAENNNQSQYEEKYNDVILNKLVPEDRKEEFDLQESKPESKSRPKKGSLKFNLGKKTKKSKQHNKEQQVGKNKNAGKAQEDSNESIKDKKTKTKKSHKSNALQNGEENKKQKRRNNKHHNQQENKQEDINIKQVQEDSDKDDIIVDEPYNYRGEFAEEDIDDDNDDIIWSDENFKKQ
ncbi:MAG: hypothetical protein ACI3VR_13265 [Intestinibacter sp.]|uniref:hypothetical protein n=1 Tax=Intestinibacter sp. TaxID=1965304 RepID=UPI003F185A13